MTRIALLFAAIMVAAAPARADLKDDFAKCAATNGLADRLDCHDSLAKKLGLSVGKTAAASPVAPLAVPTTGKWASRIEASPIDDSKNVFLSLPANEEIKSGIHTVKPVLLARCKENTTEVFVLWGLYLGMGETTILSRLDAEKATSQSWSISTDYKASFYDGNDVEYLKKLLNHKKLLLQVTPYGESPVTATFDIDGLSGSINPLREFCKW